MFLHYVKKNPVSSEISANLVVSDGALNSYPDKAAPTRPQLIT